MIICWWWGVSCPRLLASKFRTTAPFIVPNPPIWGRVCSHGVIFSLIRREPFGCEFLTSTAKWEWKSRGKSWKIKFKCRRVVNGEIRWIRWSVFFFCDGNFSKNGSINLYRRNLNLVSSNQEFHISRTFSKVPVGLINTVIDGTFNTLNYLTIDPDSALIRWILFAWKPRLTFTFSLILYLISDLMVFRFISDYS